MDGLNRPLRNEDIFLVEDDVDLGEDYMQKEKSPEKPMSPEEFVAACHALEGAS